MMAIFVIIFPLALVMALGTIGLMLSAYGGKMIAALRLEPYAKRNALPCPPSGERTTKVRLSSRSAAHNPILLAA